MNTVTSATPGSTHSVLPVVLVAIGDAAMCACADRVIAAVGARGVAVETPSRRSWLAAAAVVLDDVGAQRCAQAGLPRRDGILVVGPGTPTAQLWAAAIAVGGQQVCSLPAQEDELVGHLAEVVHAGSPAGRSGRVVGVTAGRGGAGASVFAAALALCARDALLIDIDPSGGGIDLLMGIEAVPGLRWPDLRVNGGRLAWPAVREVLPRRDGVSLLSGTRTFHDIEPVALAAVVESGRRGGVTVICDIPRQLTPAAVCALQYSDLVVVLTTCDVRGAAGAASMVSVLATVNPAVGLVVRGPSPGGLSARDVAAASAAPLLAAMRPEPALGQRLERGGLRLSIRSPLASAARNVLDIAHQNKAGRAA